MHVFPVKNIVHLAKKAGIRYRIGTSHRLYNLLNCNVLVNISRKNSSLHESQLNLQLLQKILQIKPFQLHKKEKGVSFSSSPLSLDEIYNLLNINLLDISTPVDNLLLKDKFNLILHPKSKGSAREWKLENYLQLIELLPVTDFNVFISGTKEEAQQMEKTLLSKISSFPNVHNICGQLTLNQYITFISKCDGMLAASTGPLHIASILGKHALGIFPPMPPIHPQRWQPIGKKVKIFCLDKKCSKCRKSRECECMQSITPQQIQQYLMSITSHF
ncbi:MAG: glycosyltransferase family 9 protein [Bacteroidales bacterium]|nr:glycosyltransferase family 9 protein [Bacteroidales bacterium]